MKFYKAVLLIILFYMNFIYAGQYIPRPNSEISKATQLAVFARVIIVEKLESKQTNYLGQRITIRVDGVFKGKYHEKTLTFITETSKKISLVGGSLRDIQMMVGHSSLQTTQRYIESDSQSQRKVVDLL